MNQQASNIIATGMGIMLLMFIIGFAIFITWTISLIDVIKSDFTNPNNKTMWIILLLLIAPLAAILYQLIGKAQKAPGPEMPTITDRPKPRDKEGKWEC